MDLIKHHAKEEEDAKKHFSSDGLEAMNHKYLAESTNVYVK
jgi:hypothetical protein